MGSLARVTVFYTDIETWIKKNKSIKKYAAAFDGKNVKIIEGIKEAIIIIGNEGNGVSAAIMKLADEKITILKKGEAESLNAAVATGIILAILNN
jgi:TrmH family RNA methyltransferase